jgi:hypothetical protein
MPANRPVSFGRHLIDVSLGRGRLWSQELGAIEMSIDPIVCQQLCVGTTLHDASLIDDQNGTRSVNRGQAVSDDERSAPGHKLLQGILDEPLCAQVYA